MICFRAFIPILIDRLQRQVDLEEPPGPFFRDSLILLNGWVRFYGSWTGIEEEGKCQLLLVVFNVVLFRICCVMCESIAIASLRCRCIEIDVFVYEFSEIAISILEQCAFSFGCIDIHKMHDAFPSCI